MPSKLWAGTCFNAPQRDADCDYTVEVRVFKLSASFNAPQRDADCDVKSPNGGDAPDGEDGNCCFNAPQRDADCDAVAGAASRSPLLVARGIPSLPALVAKALLTAPGADLPAPWPFSPCWRFHPVRIHPVSPRTYAKCRVGADLPGFSLSARSAPAPIALVTGPYWCMTISLHPA